MKLPLSLSSLYKSLLINQNAQVWFFHFSFLIPQERALENFCLISFTFSKVNDIQYYPIYISFIAGFYHIFYLFLLFCCQSIIFSEFGCCFWCLRTFFCMFPYHFAFQFSILLYPVVMRRQHFFFLDEPEKAKFLLNQNYNWFLVCGACAVWYQTLKNIVPAVGQNAVPTS